MVLWLVRRAVAWWRGPSDPLGHASRVARVAQSVRDHAEKERAAAAAAAAAAAPGDGANITTSYRKMRTDRSVFDSHSVRNADKGSAKQVRIRDLRAILGLDATTGIVHVEPGVTVGEITTYLLQHHLQLECCLEMEDATLGGLAMAQGMTTHSHVCGLLSETVVAYEVVTGTGDVLHVTRDDAQHADLFRALPLSHGTLGFLVGLQLRVVPAKAWVELTYTPCRTFEAFRAGYTRVLDQAAREDPGTPFFVEGIAFGREEAVLMEGRLVDGDGSDGHAVNRIGWWFKPWFFKHVEAMLRQPEDSVTELIPIRDYLMRHDRSMCMTMATIIPYGNHPVFRFLLGWLLPPQMSFLKSNRNKETREMSIRKQCFQDVAFPARELGAALDVSDKLFGIYPLLVYPCKMRSDPGALLRAGPGAVALASSGGKHSWNLNLGIYGIPRELVQRPDELFPMVTRVRKLEAWLRSVGGFQHTYCDSFQTEEEFEAMFDHTLYDEMRGKYGASKVFPRVWEKTRPEMDWRGWLEEEREDAEDTGGPVVAGREKVE
jgi:delta24-sterol reductase